MAIEIISWLMFPKATWQARAKTINPSIEGRLPVWHSIGCTNETHCVKTNKMVCAQQRQISLGIHPVWSESLLYAHCVAKDPSFLHADSEDSDQTWRMPRLIRVFAGRILFCWFCCEAAQMGLAIKGSVDFVWLKFNDTSTQLGH